MLPRRRQPRRTTRRRSGDTIRACRADSRGSRLHRHGGAERARASLERCPAFQAYRLITVGGKRAKNLLRVSAVARLHGDIELRALGGNVEEQPVMIDAENIGAEFAEPAGDPA